MYFKFSPFVAVLLLSVACGDMNTIRPDVDAAVKAGELATEAGSATPATFPPLAPTAISVQLVPVPAPKSPILVVTPTLTYTPTPTWVPIPTLTPTPIPAVLSNNPMYEYLVEWYKENFGIDIVAQTAENAKNLASTPRFDTSFFETSDFLERSSEQLIDEVRELYSEGKSILAVYWLTRVIEIDPTSAYAYAFRASIIAGATDERCSLEEVGMRPVLLHPSKTDRWGTCEFNHLIARYEVFPLGNDEIFYALRDVNEAIRLYDGNAWYFELRGQIRERIGRSDPDNIRLAIQDFTSAISLAPNWCPYYAQRLRLYERLEDFVGAAHDLITIHELYEIQFSKEVAELRQDHASGVKVMKNRLCENRLIALAKVFMRIDDRQFAIMHPSEPRHENGSTTRLDFALNTLHRAISHEDVELLFQGDVVRSTAEIAADVRLQMVFIEGRDAALLQESVRALTEAISLIQAEYQYPRATRIERLFEARGWAYMALRDYALAYVDFNEAVPPEVGWNLGLGFGPRELGKKGVPLAFKAVASDLLGRTIYSDEVWIQAESWTGWSKDRLLREIQQKLTEQYWPPERIFQTMCKLDAQRLGCS